MKQTGAVEHESVGDDDHKLDDPSRLPLRESGIPPAHMRPARERLVDQTAESIEAALAESARTEANLNLLLRGLEQIVSGAGAARDSNSMLSRELDNLRDALARSGAQEMALKQRVRLLEQAVERARRDAALERAFFLEQEDAFLAELLTEHEREIGELRRRLMEALARTPASGVVRLGTIKIPRPATDDPEATPLPSSREPEAAAPIPYSSPAPATLPHVTPTPAPSSSKPPLARKPDPTTRPLVGYSLRHGEVAEERFHTPVPGARKP